ncbi:hypothetical protein HRS9122_00222 [Pyrenophora teres f. teres]|nr:hypothetical protein HRS9122_00222 [Pyrenophora teres f. teres]
MFPRSSLATSFPRSPSRGLFKQPSRRALVTGFSNTLTLPRDTSSSSSTLSNINVAPYQPIAPAPIPRFPVAAAPARMAFGPATPSNAPRPSPNTESDTEIGGTALLRRGLDSGDTPNTAAARRELHAIRRDHRVTARAGEEPSPTPSLDEVKRRQAVEGKSTGGTGSPLSDPPPSSQLQTPPGVRGSAFMPYNQDLDDESLALPPLSSQVASPLRGRGRSNSVAGVGQSRDHSRAGSRSPSPLRPSGHCFQCIGCKAYRPTDMYKDDGYCSFCHASQIEVQQEWGVDRVCCRGRHHYVQYMDMFNDDRTREQPTCKECRARGVTDVMPEVSSSREDAFSTLPSHGPASSQYLTADSIESSQRVSRGRAIRGAPNPGLVERRRLASEAALQVPDPPLDLSSDRWQDDPALTDRDFELLQDFHTKLDSEKLETCTRCYERWFHMGLNDDSVCKSCVKADAGLEEDEPYLYSAVNDLDPGPREADLEPLTQIDEMLIARVHCFVEVRQVRGVQYKYKGHVVNFLTNTAKVYNRLLLLPSDLDVILVRPSNYNKDPRMQRQSQRDTRVRKPVIRKWLEFLRRHHPGYRDIEIAHDNLDALGDDFLADNELIVHEVEAEAQFNATAIDPDSYIDEDPEVAAVPNLYADRDEIKQIQAQLHS